MGAKEHYHSEMRKVYQGHTKFVLDLGREHFENRKEFIRHGIGSLGLGPEHFKGKSALDLGSGNGPYLEVLREYGANVVGADILPLRPDIKKVDWDRLPFEDKTFDIVTLGRVFSVSHNPLKLAAEVGRVLKPESMVIVEDVQDLTFGQKSLMNLIKREAITPSEASEILLENKLPLTIDENNKKTLANLSHSFVGYWLEKAGLKGTSEQKYFASKDGGPAIFFMKYKIS